MVFQGLAREQAEAVWRPFFDWIASSPQELNVVSPPKVLAVPGRRFRDPAALKRIPGLVLADDRPGAPEGNIFCTGNLDNSYGNSDKNPLAASAVTSSTK